MAAFWSNPDVKPGTTVGPDATRAEIEEEMEKAKQEHDELAELAADPSEVATITGLAWPPTGHHRHHLAPTTTTSCSRECAYAREWSE